jgi:uncharacterized protein
MFRVFRFAISGLCFLFLVFNFSFAAAPEPPASPQNYVNDLAGIINDDIESKLNSYLKELEQKTTAQIFVLTIRSLDGEDIAGFSLKMAEKWKPGQKGKNNGVLITVALNDRKYRFEIGYGLEGTLPDSFVGTLGRQHLVPYFKKGDYGTGIFNAALAITGKIAEHEGIEITGMPKIKRTKQKQKNSAVEIAVFIVMFIVLGLAALASLRRRYHGGGMWYGGYGGGFGGGGFGGGGFDSFGGGGGGDFGGGGASGDW